MKIKQKWLIIFNAVLIVLVLLFVFLKLKKTQVTFDGSYGAMPSSLIEILDKHFPKNSTPDTRIVFVFNSIPTKSQLESIEKISSNTKSKAMTLALFNTNFKENRDLNFPNYMSRNLAIRYKRNNNFIDSNFFVILKNNRIDYIDEISKFPSLVYLVLKRLNPDKAYNDYVLPVSSVTEKVANRLKEGDLRLYSLRTGDYITIDSAYLKDISSVHFYHAVCSSCQLKTIFSQANIKQIFEKGKIVHVFSFLADTFELTRALSEQKIDLEVLIDKEDRFGLFSVISNDKYNPIVIEGALLNERRTN